MTYCDSEKITRPHKTARRVVKKVSPPAKRESVSPATEQAPIVVADGTKITDIDLSFWTLIKFFFKASIAAVPAMALVAMFWVFVGTLGLTIATSLGVGFGGLIG